LRGSACGKTRSATTAPLLEDSGFEIASYEQLPGWDDLVAAGFGAVVSEQTRSSRRWAKAAAAATVLEASITLEMRPYCGHVFAVAVRP